MKRYIFIINTSNKSFYHGKINGLKNNIGVLDSLYKEEHYDGILQYIKFINLESDSLIYELLEYGGEDKIKFEKELFQKSLINIKDNEFRLLYSFILNSKIVKKKRNLV